ncbi:hypothetical protein HOY80DRAFT_978946 [Tuber brumale]|nr:hypothetical protein HOY80DRAFT_978946 [Tuber brumale]
MSDLNSIIAHPLPQIMARSRRVKFCVVVVLYAAWGAIANPFSFPASRTSSGTGILYSTAHPRRNGIVEIYRQCVVGLIPWHRTWLLSSNSLFPPFT